MLEREISVQNNLGELERLNAFLEETGTEWNFSCDQLFQLNLVLEEVVSNIIFHGFRNDQVGEKILIGLSFNDGELKICITDHGIEFNPLNIPPPDDLGKPLRERKIGGLGFYLIRQMMDKVEYRRKNDSNILVLTKKI